MKFPQQVASELEAILASPQADELYDQVPGARTPVHRRLILNTDLARELSIDYRTPEQRVRYTRATFEPSQKYVFERFMDTVEQSAGTNRRALILAGGPASGKSYSLDRMDVEDYDLIFDTTLSNYPKARTCLSQLIQFGWEFQVRYVHRPYDLAVAGMLERALRTGRYVPLGHPSRLATVHMFAQQTLVQIAKDFPEVDCQIAGNFWPEKWDQYQRIEIRELDKDGVFHYNSLDDLHAAQKPIFDDFKEEHAEAGPLIAAIATPYV